MTDNVFKMLYVLNGDKNTNVKNFEKLYDQFGGDYCLAGNLISDLLEPEQRDDYFPEYNTKISCCKFDETGKVYNKDRIYNKKQYEKLAYPTVGCAPTFAYELHNTLKEMPDSFVAVINHKHSNFNLTTALNTISYCDYRDDLRIYIVIDNVNDVDIDAIKAQAKPSRFKIINEITDDFDVPRPHYM